MRHLAGCAIRKLPISGTDSNYTVVAAGKFDVQPDPESSLQASVQRKLTLSTSGRVSSNPRKIKRVSVRPSTRVDYRVRLGSGANIIKCMFLSAEKALQILSGQDRGPNFRSGGCVSG